MVRREIKSFDIETGLGVITLDAPFSLASAISSGRLSESDLGERISFSADVYTDSVALSMKNIYIKLGRFSAPCEVLINGNKVDYTLN